MKIWLDTTIADQTSDKIGDCVPAECSGDCDHSQWNFLSIKPSLNEDGLHSLYTGMLQQATPLHRQICGDERWLVCHPTGAGQLGILDRRGGGAFDALLKSRPPG